MSTSQPLFVLDAGGNAREVEAFVVGTDPDTGAPILRPGQSNVALELAAGNPADAAWDGTAAAPSMVAISKAEYVKLEAIRSILSGTLPVSGPLTNAQLTAQGLGKDSSLTNIDASVGAVTAAVTALGTTPIPAGSAVIGAVDMRANGAAVTNAAPTPVTSQTADVALSYARPANTTPYSAGDVIGATTSAGGAVLQFASMGQSGKALLLTSAELEIDTASIISGMTTFVLHLYSATPPSALADNDPFTTTTSGDRAAYLGFIIFTPGVNGGGMLYAALDGINKQRKLVGTDLFGYLVTTAGWTPTSALAFKITLHAMGQ